MSQMLTCSFGIEHITSNNTVSGFIILTWDKLIINPGPHPQWELTNEGSLNKWNSVVASNGERGLKGGGRPNRKGETGREAKEKENTRSGAKERENGTNVKNLAELSYHKFSLNFNNSASY